MMVAESYETCLGTSQRDRVRLRPRFRWGKLGLLRDYRWMIARLFCRALQSRGLGATSNRVGQNQRRCAH